MTPSAPPKDPLLVGIESAIAAAMGPVWATIRRLEAAVQGGPVRAPPRAGPGYRAEFIDSQPAPRVAAAVIAPVLTNQGTRPHNRTQDVAPFPSSDRPAQTEDDTSGPLVETHAGEDYPRVDDEIFPALGSTPGPNNRRRRNNEARQRQRRSVPGATGPDTSDTRNVNDGYIPITSNHSRIRPLFSNVVTQTAVVQQQQSKQSAEQARKIQGRRPNGNQGPLRKPLNDAELTEVTVIRFGGLEDEEAERKFRARNPIEIVQAVQRELAKRAKNPPAVLSGRWSVSSNSMGNFVYTLGGIIHPRELMTLKQHLCSPFKGHTELVPTKGWTWIQLQQVPMEDLDNCVWGSEDLLNAFIANPCFKDALICVQPHWQGNPLNNDKMFSTVLAAIIDEDNSICQLALSHGIRMFGAQVKFLRCGDNPTLQQCGHCHMLGHYPSSPRCKQPKNSVKCYQCGGQHDGRDHDYECNKKHKVIGKCDCILKCLLCKKTDHHARSRSCLKQGNFAPPRLPEPHTDNEPFQIVGRKRTTKGKERQPPYSPRLSSFLVPEVKHILLPACPTEEGKNVLLCMCCALPSVAEYKQCFVSPHISHKDPGSLPTARIVSSKGKSVLDIYSDLQKRKAYGMVLLANDQTTRNSIDMSDLHDEDEIAHMLQEAEREVLEQEMLAASREWGDAVDDGTLPSPFHRLPTIPPPFDNVPITRDGPSHPPIGVENTILNTITKKGQEKASDMGWGPSVSMIIDA
ncbi:hypothetical protein V8E53_011665 [Lactarius tabidus]